MGVLMNKLDLSTQAPNRRVVDLDADDVTIGERLGIPGVGWMPEMVMVLACLSTLGLAVGALAPIHAVAIVALCAAGSLVSTVGVSSTQPKVRFA